MRITIYPWQRFWVPREGSIALSDGGFLRDPRSESAHYSAYKLDTLSDLQHFRALALLGEPGIGKSSTLQAESTASEQQTQENGRVSIHVDLRSFSSDTLLKKHQQPQREQANVNPFLTSMQRDRNVRVNRKS